MVLARFRWFFLVLGRFSLFLTLLSTVRSYYPYKLRLLHKLRDTNLSYLLKDKKRYKKVCITVCIKVFKKHILIRRGGEGVCIALRGNLF